jgi:Icc-related predicted phosphoesterase
MSDIDGASARFLYVTDLHGDPRAYAALPDLCDQHGVRIIVQGGDMLPKGRDMFAAQREFLSVALPACLDRCADAGVTFFGLFGNDDLRAVHDDWLALTRARPGVHDLAERWYALPGGFTIRGCSWVPDYLFGLKDWCLRDRADAAPVLTRGRSIVTSADGVTEITDPVAFFAARPTLQEHLDSLVGPADRMTRAVMVSHAPPAQLGLGRLWNGEDVGSKSVHAWVSRHQPLLTLSGHIHKSPDVGMAMHGAPLHTAALGRTTCHQPGQDLPYTLSYSVVELSASADEAVSIQWRRLPLLTRRGL